MWNPQAIRLMDWATDENNRVRAQKMAKVAKKMENARGNKGDEVIK